MARTVDGSWLRLEDGGWIWSPLVDDVPLGLPVTRDIPSTPVPLPTPVLTPTPRPSPIVTSPHQGNWRDSVRKNIPFDTPDGLRITLSDLHFPNEAYTRLPDYFDLRAGQTCRDCLVIVLEIENPYREDPPDGTTMPEGNNYEYVVRQDFALFQGDPQNNQSMVQVPCSHFSAVPLGGDELLRPIGYAYQPVLRSLCFRHIADDDNTVKREYVLAYTHIWFYDADPDSATGSQPEREQTRRTGWTVFFALH